MPDPAPPLDLTLRTCKLTRLDAARFMTHEEHMQRIGELLAKGIFRLLEQQRTEAAACLNPGRYPHQNNS